MPNRDDLNSGSSVVWLNGVGDEYASWLCKRVSSKKLSRKILYCGKENCALGEGSEMDIRVYRYKCFILLYLWMLARFTFFRLTYCYLQITAIGRFSENFFACK